MSITSHESPMPPGSSVAPERHCGICARAMEHVTTLPRTPHYPTQLFYRCAACPSAELVEVP